MGQIISQISIQNVEDSSRILCSHALVDTGCTYLVLPKAWKEKLGKFESSSEIELQSAEQKTLTGDLWGPVKITIEGFRSIYNEVLFLDMKPESGEYEPLLGYIPLEQCGAVVDMGHRLLPVKYLDLK